MYDHRIELVDRRGKPVASIEEAHRAVIHSAGYAMPLGCNWRAVVHVVGEFEKAGEPQSAQLFLSGVTMGLLGERGVRTRAFKVAS